MPIPKRPDILMSVPDDNFSEQLMLTLLRQMIQSIEEVNTSLHEMNTTQLDMVQRLTSLEASPVASLEARLVLLESDRLREQGAHDLIKWIKDYTPWLFALILGGVAYFTKKP